MATSDYNPAEEIVVIVDKDNREIGVVSRREMRRQGLIHRASYILLFNRPTELFEQKSYIKKLDFYHSC